MNDKRYFIPVSQGIYGHFEKMKQSIWLYLWLIDKMTSLEGEVLGGKPVVFEEVQKDLNVLTRRTYVRWISELEKDGYIKTTRTPSGLVIRVNKAKKIFNKAVPKMAHRYAKNGASNIRQDNIQDNNNITNVIQKADSFGNEDINQVSQYFLDVFQLPKEDCTQKQSRRYWHLLLKESKTGVEGVKWLVELAYADEFYRNNITSSKDLYYKRIKLMARRRGDKPKIAVMN